MPDNKICAAVCTAKGATQVLGRRFGEAFVWCFWGHGRTAFGHFWKIVFDNVSSSPMSNPSESRWEPLSQHKTKSKKNKPPRRFSRQNLCGLCAPSGYWVLNPCSGRNVSQRSRTVLLETMSIRLWAVLWPLDSKRAMLRIPCLPSKALHMCRTCLEMPRIQY